MNQTYIIIALYHSFFHLNPRSMSMLNPISHATHHFKFALYIKQSQPSSGKGNLGVNQSKSAMKK